MSLKITLVKEKKKKDNSGIIYQVGMRKKEKVWQELVTEPYSDTGLCAQEEKIALMSSQSVSSRACCSAGPVSFYDNELDG